MNRIVNLISHLPSFIQSIREIKNITKAEEPEVQAVEDASEVIKDNMFVVSTDEAGVERYEKMFGLTPSKDDSLQDRQARVLTYYTNTVVHTLRGLVERLNIICGADNYTLELIPAEYKIKINLHIRVKNLINTLRSMLVDMIPANMLCVYTINRNTHEDLAKYSIHQLMQLTHEELQGDTLEERISTKEGEE